MSDYKFILRNINYIQTIISQYVVGTSRPKELSIVDNELQTNENILPQTSLTTNGEKKENQQTFLSETNLSNESTAISSKDKNIMSLIPKKQGQLSKKNDRKAIIFLDIYKSPVKCWVNMIEFVDDSILPESTTKSCWWDRHTFTTRPLGCPIKVLDKEEAKIIAKKLNKTENHLFVKTEGIFCSLPCIKRYINNQIDSSYYKESLNLLSLMAVSYYEDFFSDDGIQQIPEAPHWKLLKEYGGHLTIIEFRNMFGNYTFKETPNEKYLMIPTGNLIEESTYKSSGNMKSDNLSGGSQK